MKKLCLLLTIPALLTLTGCGNEGEEGAGEGTLTGDVAPFDPNTIIDIGENVNLKIAFHVNETTAEAKAYQRRVDAFVEKYASLNVSVTTIFKARTAGAAGYEDQLIAQQQNGELPDVITFDAPNCAAYADAGLIADISNGVSQEEKDDFISLNTYQDKLYGLPIQESSAGFFFNKALFNEAGIDYGSYTVENPWTFSQFQEACQKLKNIGVEVPVDLRLNKTTDETATYLLYPLIYAAGGEFVSADGKTATGYFNSTKSKNGFKFIKECIDSSYTNYTVKEENFVDFSSRKVGMFLSSGWTIPDLRLKYKLNDGDWGLLPYPKSEIRASATGSWSYAVTNNYEKDGNYVPRNVVAASVLLRWMASADSTNDITNATGMIPCRKSCNPNYAEGSPQALLLKQLQQSGKARPTTVGYPQFSKAFASVIFNLKDTDYSTAVENATSELQNELNKIK